MDYLEGFLIGSIWSDTDYRTRRHVNVHVWLALIMAAAFVALTLFPDRRGNLVLVSWPLSLILLIVLVVLTPLLSIFYRRLPFYVKPFAIVLYAFKYLLLFYVLEHLFRPLVTFEQEGFFSMIFARMDGHIEVALDKLAQSGGILMTAAGVVVGGLWVLAEGLAILAILILIPLMAIVLFKSLQYGLDWLVRSILDKELAEVSSLPLEEKPWSGELTVMEDDLQVSLPRIEAVPQPPVRTREARQAALEEKKAAPVREKPPRKKEDTLLYKIQTDLGRAGKALAAAFGLAAGKIKSAASALGSKLKKRKKADPAPGKSGMRLPRLNRQARQEDGQAADHEEPRG